MSKPKAKQEYGDVATDPVFTPRFVVAIVLAFIAWFVMSRVRSRRVATVDAGSQD